MMNNTLYVAWRSGDPSHGRWGPVGRLEHAETGYRFVYTRGASTLEGFGALPGMADLNAVYESEELFPFFANRLLARSRPEYEAFLVWGGFDPDHPPDPISLFGVTEGRRETDSFELFSCPVPDSEGCYVTKFFLHGMRWITEAARVRVQNLRSGEQLTLQPEPSNPKDLHAIAVLAATLSDGVRIGYVPRYLARDVEDLLQSCAPDCVKLIVERLNADAPLQQRVLCRITACWPEGFQPCSREDYQPIVDVSPSMSA